MRSIHTRFTRQSGRRISRPRLVSGRAAIGALPVILLAAPLVSCTGVDTLRPPRRIASKIVALAGRDQRGTVGEPLDELIVVRVTDDAGEPVPGIPIAFTVTAGGGTVTPAADTSDMQGEARAHWTLGPTSGTDSMAATAPGLADSVVTFTATAEPGPPTQLAFIAQPVTTPATHPIAPAVQVAVHDANGNLVTASTAHITLALTADSTLRDFSIDADSGIATFSDIRIDRARDDLTLVASASGLAPATSASFDIVPGAAARLEIVTQPSAAVASGEPFTEQPVVRLVDAGGNHVARGGVAITTSLATGGERLDGSLAATTDSTGVAAFTDLVIVGSTGPRTLTFSAPSLETVTSDTILVGPGAAATIALHDGDEQIATVGSAVSVPPSVVVRDASGNPVPGVPVTFTVTDGGGTLAPDAPVTTNDEGIATLQSWTLGTATGTNTLRVTAAGIADAAVHFSATGTPGPASASHSTITASPTTLTAGTGSSVVEVVVRDAFDNPIAGDTVTLSATGIGNVLTQPAGVTDDDGRVTGTFSSRDAGTKVISAVVRHGVTLDATVSIVVKEPAVASVTVTPDAARELVGQRTTFTAELRDADGNELTGRAVEWTTSDAGVATVSSDGVVSGVAPGVATVTAMSGGRSGSARITVSYNEVTLRGVTYCTAGSDALRMDVFVPDASKPRPLPVAIYVHGGGWQGGSRTEGFELDEIRRQLLDRGFLVAAVDYRLAPTHKWPAQIQDVKCAVRHLRANADRYGLDSRRMGAWGSSAGGQLVAMLGTLDATSSFDVSSPYDGGGYAGFSSKVEAAVVQSGITDLTRPGELTDDFSDVFRTWPDSTSSELIHASPVTYITGDDGPFLLLHSTEDELVDPAQAQRFADRLGNAGVSETLVWVQHANHAFEPTDAPLDPDPATLVSMIVDFFTRQLGGGSSRVSSSVLPFHGIATGLPLAEPAGEIRDVRQPARAQQARRDR